MKQKTPLGMWLFPIICVLILVLGTIGLKSCVKLIKYDAVEIKWRTIK